MEIPRLGVVSELQLLAYTTAHGNAGSLTHSVRQGLNPQPHGSWSDSFLLCHDGNSHHPHFRDKETEAERG